MKWWWLVLGLLVVVGFRVVGWYQWKRAVLTHPSTFNLVVSEPIETSLFNCGFSFRGIRFQASLRLCEEKGLDQARMGDRLVGVGVTKQSDFYGDMIELTEAGVQEKEYFPLISGWWWRRVMGNVRAYSSRLIRRVMTEPEASLLAGIVTGEKATMPAQLKTALQTTGTMHVVAASGYNVAVVSTTVMGMSLGWLGRRKAFWLGIAAIWLYTALAGADPPVVRAALMLSLTLLATHVGRAYWQLWGFGCVLLVLLGFFPWYVESLSFQLSITATIGVVWGAKSLTVMKQQLSDWWQRRALTELDEVLAKRSVSPIWIKIKQGLWEQIATTLGAWLMTTPLLLWRFGEASWMGLLVNPLVLGMVPSLMLLGVLVMAAAGIWLPLGSVMGWLAWPLTRVWVLMVKLFGLLPFGTIEATIPFTLAIGWWLILISSMSLVLLQFGSPQNEL